MSPQRRTALVSVGAACLLIVIKLVAGLASSSLGLLAEAVHSGTDLAAALVTFFVVFGAGAPRARGAATTGAPRCGPAPSPSGAPSPARWPCLPASAWLRSAFPRGTRSLR